MRDKKIDLNKFDFLYFDQFDQQGNKLGTHKFVLNKECLGKKKGCVDETSASYLYKGYRKVRKRGQR